MKVQKLKVNKFPSMVITDFEVELVTNEHGKAKVTGIIDENKEDMYMDIIFDNEWATVEGYDENDKKQSIFSGIIYNSAIEVVNGFKMLILDLVSGTILLDIEKYTRSFQNVASSYNGIFKFLNNTMKASHIQNIDSERTIENFTVQYKETDWEFIKRMASNMKTSVIPNNELEIVRYFVGINGDETLKHDFDTTEYIAKKNINNKSLSKQAFYSYIFEDRAFVPIGNKITINDKELYIYSVYGKYVGEELINKYEARDKNGFIVDKYYNFNMIGASLSGSISSVSKDMVQVSLGVDVMDSGIWFPYSTVYSTPDGAGWYCMPEVGDAIRIYFPSEKAQDAFVMNAVHLGGSPDRSDPNKKSIMNKSRKQIEFTPSSLKLTNNSGMTILIDDNEGISIFSNKNVRIEATNEIEIKSLANSLRMEATKEIEIQQGNTKLKLDKDISFEGAQIKVQ